MFGRTGTPTKCGPHKRTFFSFFCNIVTSQKYWNNDEGTKETILCGALASQTVIVSNVPWWLAHSLAYSLLTCTPVKGVLRGIHILGAHIFLNRGPAWSKSGPADEWCLSVSAVHKIFGESRFSINQPLSQLVDRLKPTALASKVRLRLVVSVRLSVSTPSYEPTDLWSSVRVTTTACRHLKIKTKLN